MKQTLLLPLAMALTLLTLLACKPAANESEQAEAVSEKSTPGAIEQFHWCFMECRDQVRTAAAQYTKKAMPTATIVGISTKPIDEEEVVWMVAVDVGFDKPPLELLVRYFVSESGEQYWRAAPMTEELNGALSALAVRALIEQELTAARDSATGGEP